MYHYRLKIARTSTVDPRACENVYLLYFAPNENCPACTLRRYNLETTSVNVCMLVVVIRP